MRQSLRARLTASLGVLMVGFAVVIVSGALLERRVDRELSLIRERYIPQLALGPALKHEFEGLHRSLQDAVSAQDGDALEATYGRKDHFLRQLSKGKRLIPAPLVSALHDSLEAYYATAYDVSRRLIAAEAGEAVVEAMATMQAKHARAATLLEQATAIDSGALGRAFAEVEDAQQIANRLRLLIGVSSFAFVALLSVALGQRFLRALAELSAGFDRFGRGKFDVLIPELGDDELGHLSSQANQMADSLRRLNLERDLSDWLKAGHAGLVHDLRGELTPREVADRACRFAARYLEVPSAALYYRDEDGMLDLLGRYAVAQTGPDGSARRKFAPGEGLVGQAALEHELVLITSVPASYLSIQSGLGECAPATLVLLPLIHHDRVTGVLELSSLKPWSELSGELLLSIRETLAIALEVAHARSSLRQLLARTQAQAEQLAAQEEELRAANEELQTQQEALQQVNGQLMQRGDELETQHQVLAASNHELAEARRGLEQKAQELGTVSAYKSQFLANMSHELRTPLNSMLLLSSLLSANEAHNLSAKQVEYCRTIHGAGKDLLALINQVLDLAKVEAGKQELRLAEVPVRDLADYARRIFEALAIEKGLELQTIVDPELPRTVVTDPRKLEQVLNNLLGNAIKFTERGHVRLRLRRAGEADQPRRPDLPVQGALAIEVSDTGAGIPSAHQERIFAPFEQLDGNSDRRHGGTGLGLTIARELVTLLGGELQLHSIEGEGSRFVCFLPFEPSLQVTPLQVRHQPTRAPEPSEPAQASKASDDAQAAATLSGRKILVADDDMRTVYALSALLRAHGAEVLTADTGRAALEVLARGSGVDLVLMDIMMPEMDGYEAMRQLRCQPRFAALPIVALTAKVMKDDRDSCLAAGASDYLPKPVDSQRLFGLLHTLLPTGGVHD